MTRSATTLAAFIAALGLFQGAAAAQEATVAEPQMFADQSWVGAQAAAERGVVVLWALGAIEQHGPHLPLSTDVDIPTAQLHRAAGRLSQQGVETWVLPPYAWGVNAVSRDFPGSIHVRPEIMTEVMLDVFRSLAAAGFAEVFCVTGHFDAAHVRAAAAAVRRAREEGVLEAWLILPAPLAGRLSLSGEAGVAIADWPGSTTEFPDLHAGDWETSVMLSIAPDRVEGDSVADLKATDLSPAAVDRWRRGGAEARAVTPDGYLGAPGDASAAKGASFVVATSDAYAAAILAARSRAAEADH